MMRAELKHSCSSETDMSKHSSSTCSSLRLHTLLSFESQQSCSQTRQALPPGACVQHSTVHGGTQRSRQSWARHYFARPASCADNCSMLVISSSQRLCSHCCNQAPVQHVACHAARCHTRQPGSRFEYNTTIILSACMHPKNDRSPSTRVHTYLTGCNLAYLGHKHVRVLYARLLLQLRPDILVAFAAQLLSSALQRVDGNRLGTCQAQR